MKKTKTIAIVLSSVLLIFGACKKETGVTLPSQETHFDLSDLGLQTAELYYEYENGHYEQYKSGEESCTYKPVLVFHSANDCNPWDSVNIIYFSFSSSLTGEGVYNIGPSITECGLGINMIPEEQDGVFDLNAKRGTLIIHSYKEDEWDSEISFEFDVTFTNGQTLSGEYEGYLCVTFDYFD
jgi:hypothetical protein